MSLPNFVQPYPLHQNIRRQCARPSWTQQYLIMPVSRPADHYSHNAPSLTFRPPLTRDLQSSFSASIFDDFMTPPSAVAGDLATVDSFPWREYCLDDPFTAPVTDCTETSYQSTGTGHCAQAMWPMTTGNSSFTNLQTPQAHHGSSASTVAPESLAHRGYGPALRGSSALSVGHVDNGCVRRSSLLSSRVDLAKSENVESGQSFMSTTECDNAPSPSTTDTYSNDPRTPGSSRHSDSSVHVQDERTHDNLFFEHAVPKLDSSFGPLSSNPSTSTSAATPAYAPALCSASFGNMTLAAAFHTQSGQWPTIAMPTSNNYHPHGHPMPTGIPDFTSTYVDFQSVQPAAIQQSLRPEAGAIQGFGEGREEDCSESFSEGSSDMDVEDNVAEDMNDRALHDAHARRARDKYLLKMRNEGFSYKEIKRMGNFREAESTLRGRVRVLTKDKTERVRRPEWTAEDVSPSCLRFHLYAAVS